MWETWIRSLGWEDLLEEGMATHASIQYSCLENPHGQMCLAGYSPLGRKQSDTTGKLSSRTHTPTHTLLGDVLYWKVKRELRLWERGTADSMATLFPLRAPKKPWHSSWRPDLKDNNGYWNPFQGTSYLILPKSHRTTTTRCSEAHSIWLQSPLSFHQPVSYFRKARYYQQNTGFPGGSDGKESACNIRDPGLMPASGRYPGEGNGNPLQYSCLENFVNRGTSCAEITELATTEWLSHIHTNKTQAFCS